MRIDNSQMKTWHMCPFKWKERYANNLEKKTRTSDALAFGTRLHELLEVRLLRQRDGTGTYVFPPCDGTFEPEAQEMFAAYQAQYPIEAFEVLDVERYFEVPLPHGHTYIGKFDGIVRASDTGMLNILEHKTEKRGGKANHPQAWAVRPQASLYIWAAEQIYAEPFDQIILDVLTRQSPAGREPCMFSRQNLQRTAVQKEDAVRNITWVADEIERTELEYAGQEKWPADYEQCHNGFWKCEYFDLHITGRSPELLAADFQEAEEYLSL